MITRHASARSFLVTGRNALPSDLSCQALAAYLFKRRHSKNRDSIIGGELVQKDIGQRRVRRFIRQQLI